MLVAMSLVATAIQMSIRSRRECKMAQQMRQTELLADAGQSRAIASLLDASKCGRVVATKTRDHESR